MNVTSAHEDSPRASVAEAAHAAFASDCLPEKGLTPYGDMPRVPLFRMDRGDASRSPLLNGNIKYNNIDKGRKQP